MNQVFLFGVAFTTGSSEPISAHNDLSCGHEHEIAPDSCWYDAAGDALFMPEATLH
jgi:hypothetical protein